jgi:phosphoesterase RecJ-like protein
MEIDWEPFRKIVESNQRFVLSSHVRPDADAIGSELGMLGMLEQLGKDVRIINPSALVSNRKFLDPNDRVRCLADSDVSDEDVLNTDVHIVLDTSAWGQLGQVGKLLKKSSAKKVVIDHHVSSDDLGAIEFKDSTSDSTGSLVFQLADVLEVSIVPEVATALFCAIATDTGWFRFPSTSSRTLRTVADLIDFGATPHLIYQQLYEQSSLPRVQLTARVLERVAVECEGKLAHTFVKWSDFVETKAHPSDTEDLVNECLKIAGTECAFIAVELQNKQVKFSFRSRVMRNVAEIAEQFGGGGHKQASGALLNAPLSDARDKVLDTFREALK